MTSKKLSAHILPKRANLAGEIRYDGQQIGFWRIVPNGYAIESSNTYAIIFSERFCQNYPDSNIEQVTQSLAHKLFGEKGFLPFSGYVDASDFGTPGYQIVPDWKITAEWARDNEAGEIEAKTQRVITPYVEMVIRQLEIERRVIPFHVPATEPETAVQRPSNFRQKIGALFKAVFGA